MRFCKLWILLGLTTLLPYKALPQFDQVNKDGVQVMRPQLPFFQAQFYGTSPGQILYVDQSGSFASSRTAPIMVPSFGLCIVGDSRVAPTRTGEAVGQDVFSQAQRMSEFNGRVVFTVNDAVAGTTIAQAVSAYYSHTQAACRPSAHGNVPVYVHVQTGINNIFDGQFGAWYQAYLGLIQQITADGMTPILHTVYYSGAAPWTNEMYRLQENDVIRGLNGQVMNGIRIGIVDIDARLPASLVNEWYGSATITASVTGYVISSGTITVTAANTFSAGQNVTLATFPSSSACLNGLSGPVLSSGLTSASFQIANIGCANALSRDTGYAQIVGSDSTHLSPYGNAAVYAPTINQDFSAYLAHSFVGAANTQDTWFCRSGSCRWATNANDTWSLGINGLSAPKPLVSPLVSSGGSQFTLSTSTCVAADPGHGSGGATSGNMTILTTGVCTFNIQMGGCLADGTCRAPNALHCSINDRSAGPATTNAYFLATAAAAVSVTGTFTAGDILDFGCMAF